MPKLLPLVAPVAERDEDCIFDVVPAPSVVVPNMPAEVEPRGEPPEIATCAIASLPIMKAPPANTPVASSRIAVREMFIRLLLF